MKLLKLVPDHTNLQFMRWRNVALVLSLIATVVSIGFTAYRGLHLGIDFVGGQVIRVEFQQPIKIDDLRAKVAQLGVGEASIQALGNDKTYQVRLPKPEGPAAAPRAPPAEARRPSGGVKPSRHEAPGRASAGLSRRSSRCRRVGLGQGQ